ncbi:IS1/IS1595 family N-terminal zinc-binding domain-containing protein [Deinococcus oregonensis]|uniref:IS1/IS1595 family N-terminal zinc-binding domain-containing protein n=1 Tax=Deinococcus oregonensis TaxID=1805970 RepID=UPI00406BA6CB
MIEVHSSINGLRCPAFEGVYIVKNGHAYPGKQRYLCRVCRYQFTLNHTRTPVAPETVILVARLLSERLSHRRICRVVGVSRS